MGVAPELQVYLRNN
jgi:hypothetical protein